ncbi:hypothetical protein BDV97DRAFT_373968 [Delphinella strobiligena]|nr:hypothetical protein BDV97DRAFT_373968 [Delphinella strobiligena]
MCIVSEMIRLDDIPQRRVSSPAVSSISSNSSRLGDAQQEDGRFSPSPAVSPISLYPNEASLMPRQSGESAAYLDPTASTIQHATDSQYVPANYEASKADLDLISSRSTQPPVRLSRISPLQRRAKSALAVPQLKAARAYESTLRELEDLKVVGARRVNRWQEKFMSPVRAVQDHKRAAKEALAHYKSTRERRTRSEDKFKSASATGQSPSPPLKGNMQELEMPQIIQEVELSNAARELDSNPARQELESPLIHHELPTAGPSTELQSPAHSSAVAELPDYTSISSVSQERLILNWVDSDSEWSLEWAPDRKEAVM